MNESLTTMFHPGDVKARQLRWYVVPAAVFIELLPTTVEWSLSVGPMTTPMDTKTTDTITATAGIDLAFS
jgi:hypothetical protein